MRHLSFNRSNRFLRRFYKSEIIYKIVIFQNFEASIFLDSATIQRKEAIVRMATQLSNSASTGKPPVNPRILAHMTVQATWTDKQTGNTVTVEGMTENIGETGTLVNMTNLPPVGSEVSLRIIDEGETIMEVPVEVIRVERNPGKPLAAFSVVSRIKEWREKVLTAAQEWVNRHWRVDYEEEWVN